MTHIKNISQFPTLVAAHQAENRCRRPSYPLELLSKICFYCHLPLFFLSSLCLCLRVCLFICLCVCLCVFHCLCVSLSLPLSRRLPYHATPGQTFITNPGIIVSRDGGSLSRKFKMSKFRFLQQFICFSAGAICPGWKCSFPM